MALSEALSYFELRFLPYYKPRDFTSHVGNQPLLPMEFYWVYCGERRTMFDERFLLAAVFIRRVNEWFQSNSFLLLLSIKHVIVITSEMTISRVSSCLVLPRCLVKRKKMCIKWTQAAHSLLQARNQLAHNVEGGLKLCLFPGPGFDLFVCL